MKFQSAKGNEKILKEGRKKKGKKENMSSTKKQESDFLSAMLDPGRCNEANDFRVIRKSNFQLKFLYSGKLSIK